MAFGEIIRQKDGVKRVSTTRQKSYISQVTSSRVVAPTKEGGDQLHNDDAADEQDDSFFEGQSKFDNIEEISAPTEWINSVVTTFFQEFGMPA